MKTIRMFRDDGKYVDVPEDAPDVDVYRRNWPGKDEGQGMKDEGSSSKDEGSSSKRSKKGSK